MKLINIEIKKSRKDLSIFRYPCETICDNILDGRNIYFYGLSGKVSELVCKLKCVASVTSNLSEATDVIILPNPDRQSESTIEGYYSELSYYQNASAGFLNREFDKIKNIIYLLPPHATEVSTHYSQMADYATSWYINGRSKYGARSGNFVYGIELSEVIDVDKMYNIILYLLSSNSNHMVCDIIKMDR